MQRIDGPTRSENLPPPASTGAGGSSPGFFSKGNPVTGVPATTMTDDWANMVQEELVNAIALGGTPLDKSNFFQLRDMLTGMFAKKTDIPPPYVPPPPYEPPPPPEPYVPPPPYDPQVYVGEDQLSVRVMGDVIIKAGTKTGSYTEGGIVVDFATYFPTKCFVVLPIVLNLSAGNTRDVWAQVVAKGPNGFVAFLQRSGGTGNNDSSDGIDWLAIGI